MTGIPSSRALRLRSGQAPSRNPVELSIAFAAGFVGSAEFILSERSESNGLGSE
jgi:hypothetical protein